MAFFSHVQASSYSLLQLVLHSMFLRGKFLPLRVSVKVQETCSQSWIMVPKTKKNEHVAVRFGHISVPKAKPWKFESHSAMLWKSLNNYALLDQHTNFIFFSFSKTCTSWSTQPLYFLTHFLISHYSTHTQGASSSMKPPSLATLKKMWETASLSLLLPKIGMMLLPNTVAVYTATWLESS